MVRQRLQPEVVNQSVDYSESLMEAKSECIRFVHQPPGNTPELTPVRWCLCTNVLHFDLGDEQDVCPPL